MPGDCNGEQQHQQLRPPVLLHNAEDAETNGQPHHRNRYDFHTQRDGAILPEIADIATQSGMI